MLFDLVMWTKDGDRSLPYTLDSIEKVVPSKFVHKKIMVDDSSTDGTVNLGKSYGWQVYPNPSYGIGAGANEAFRHVDCDFFASFEQDVILSPRWMNLFGYMHNDQVAVAQGIRLATEPTLRKWDEYSYAKAWPRYESFYKNRSRAVNTRDMGFSLDNNIYRTKVIREIGGFPTDCPTCCDALLFRRIMLETRYSWVIDQSIVSTHYKENVDSFIKQSVLMRRMLSEKCNKTPACLHEVEDRKLVLAYRFFASPIKALEFAIPTKHPMFLKVIPMLQLAYLRDGLKN
jgi:glycosyltransferase involved in cell wall biosynthesis